MIDFLYGLDYEDHRFDADFRFPGGTKSIPAMDQDNIVEEPSGFNALSLLVNAQAYIIADKYDIQSLKEWAATKYEEVLLETWNSTSFIESARLIFDNTTESDRMLREIIVRRASKHAKALFDRGEFVALLQSHNDFAVDVLKDVVLNPQDDAHAVVIDSWGFGTTKKDKKKSRF